MHSTDYERWEVFLSQTKTLALDSGIETWKFLDHLSAALSDYHTPAFASSLRVSDILLSNLAQELADSESASIPECLLDFANSALVSTYPPEPRNKVVAQWTIRSLTRILDVCPSPKAVETILKLVGDGIRIWARDQWKVFDDEEYVEEVGTLGHLLSLVC